MRHKGEQLIVCMSCERRITIRSFCPHCGTPTPFATEPERVAYELDLWRHQRDAVAPAAAIAPTARSRQVQEPQPTTNGHHPKTNGHHPKKVAHVQLLPQDGIAVSNGNGDQRIEVLYRPNGASPARKKREEKPPRSRGRSKRPKRSAPSEARNDHPVADSFELIGDESLRFTELGRTSLRKARLTVTWYRVALISGSRARWIPLEEVQRVRLADKATVEIDAGTEQLRFIPQNGTTPGLLLEMITKEVASARVPNSPRHHPDILQWWCEHSSDRYNGGRLRFFAGSW